MLQKRNQRRRHRDDLLGRDVHVLHPIRGREHELILIAARDHLVGQATFAVQRGVGLGDHVLAFLDSRKIVDLIADPSCVDPPVRGFEEAVLVGAGVDRQRVDQADVGAFRRFDRADPAVVGGVHVAHLEARALAGQAARTQGRDPPLVGDLGQRVVLVHELRELRGAEKFLGGGGDRLGVDQILRGKPFGFGQAQPLLDRALDPHQSDAEHVFGHLADAADAAVAEVVDVVHRAVAVADVDQHLEHRQNIFHRQHAGRMVLARHAGDRAPPVADPAVEFHPADVG